MTTAQEYLERRWTALILLCVAQFIVVLDASIVNVALPSIGKGLNFSEANLPWVVNAYVIAFGGFLLLGGRAADLLGRRRVFMAGLSWSRVASLAGRIRRQPGPADRRPRRAGPGRGDHLAGGALDRHHALQGRRRAQQGARRLGRGRRLGRRRRRPPRRHPHRRPRLGVGAVGERAGRAASPLALTPRPDPGEPLRVGDASLRRRRRGHRHRRPLGPGLRAPRRQQRGLGLDQDRRPAGARRWSLIGAFVAIELRSKAPLVPFRIFRLRTLTGRERRRPPARRVAVLDVLLHLAVHAAGARLQRDPRRALVPAAGAHDHRRGRASAASSSRGSASSPSWQPGWCSSPSAWSGSARSRSAADSSPTSSARRCSRRSASGFGFVTSTIAAVSGVARPGAGPRERPDQHLAADRRRARPGGAVDDRHHAHRRRAWRAGTLDAAQRAHRGLPERLPRRRGDRRARLRRDAGPDPHPRQPGARRDGERRDARPSTVPSPA